MKKHTADIVEKKEGPFTLYSKNDGFDYRAVWRDFIEGKRDGVSVIRLEDVREVYVVEVGDRKFILKIDWYVPKRLEKKIRFILFSPFFSRQMRQINSAIAKGCRLLPEFYFVAEKREGGLITHSYILQEFIEGTHFMNMEEARLKGNEIMQAVRELHGYGLAHCDLNLDNIFVTQTGIRFIDLSCTGSIFGGMGKDIVRLRRLFGLSMPLTTFREKLAFRYTVLKFALQDFIRGESR